MRDSDPLLLWASQVHWLVMENLPWPKPIWLLIVNILSAYSYMRTYTRLAQPQWNGHKSQLQFLINTRSLLPNYSHSRNTLQIGLTSNSFPNSISNILFTRFWLIVDRNLLVPSHFFPCTFGRTNFTRISGMWFLSYFLGNLSGYYLSFKSINLEFFC